MDFERAKKRLEGCYITVPDHVPRPRPRGRSGGDPAQCALPARQRHHASATARCSPAVPPAISPTMTFEERVSGRRGGGGRSRRQASRSPWARRRPARWSCSRLAKAAARSAPSSSRSPAPSISPIPRRISSSMSAAAAEAADIGIIIYNTFWTSAARLASRMVERLCQNPQCRRPEMGDAAHRRHGVRGRRRALHGPALPHRQSSDVRRQPHAGRPRLRGASVPTTGRNGASS